MSTKRGQPHSIRLSIRTEFLKEIRDDVATTCDDGSHQRFYFVRGGGDAQLVEERSQLRCDGRVSKRVLHKRCDRVAECVGDIPGDR